MRLRLLALACTLLSGCTLEDERQPPFEIACIYAQVAEPASLRIQLDDGSPPELQTLLNASLSEDEQGRKGASITVSFERRHHIYQFLESEWKNATGEPFPKSGGFNVEFQGSNHTVSFYTEDVWAETDHCPLGRDATKVQ